MRFFIYEYTCAQPESLSRDLRQEGAAMWRAAIEDFSAMGAVTTLADPSCNVRELPAQVEYLATVAEERNRFHELAAQADWTLAIAPESDGILLERSRWLESAGGRSLGSSAMAIELCGDKLMLADHFLRHGIATPRCYRSDEHTNGAAYPAVYKPRHGAGSEAVFVVDCEAALERAGQSEPARACRDEFVLQPYCPGLPVSIAIVAGAAGSIILPAAEQHLSDDGRLRYLGGRMPLTPAIAERAQRLAERTSACVPGLRGYLGIDMVLGNDAEGSQDVVIEVNPRLTTSYIGYRRLLRGNLAGVMVDAASGLPLPPQTWHPGMVTFTAGGHVEVPRHSAHDAGRAP